MKAFILFGKKAKYEGLSWWENFMGGHINIGKHITIYGENAMHWAINIHTKKYGYICFTLPVKTFGRYYGCHLYFSPNGTPWASTYYKSIWKENNKVEEIKARIRKLNFGHNFNTEKCYDALRALNNKFDVLYVNSFDIDKIRKSA